MKVRYKDGGRLISFQNYYETNLDCGKLSEYLFVTEIVYTRLKLYVNCAMLDHFKYIEINMDMR